MPLSPRIYNRDDLSHMEYDSLIRVIYTSHSSRISLLPRTKYRQAQHCPLCGAFRHHHSCTRHRLSCPVTCIGQGEGERASLQPAYDAHVPTVSLPHGPFVSVTVTITWLADGSATPLAPSSLPVLRAPPAPVQCLRVHNKVFDEGSSRVFLPGG